MNYILLSFIFIFFIVYLKTINYPEYFNTNTHTFSIYKLFKSTEEIRKGLMFKKKPLPKKSMLYLCLQNY